MPAFTLVSNIVEKVEKAQSNDSLLVRVRVIEKAQSNDSMLDSKSDKYCVFDTVT